jgi:hypothetical protein
MKEMKRAPDQIIPLSSAHKQLLDKLQEETVLRVEWRLRRAESIREALKVSTVSDLLGKFDALDSWLTRKLTSNLFREKVPYNVEHFIGKPPLDNPTFEQRCAFLSKMLGGTSLAVRQTLLFEAFERRMQLRGRRCMPDLRKMHSIDRGGDEFAKFQTELRRIMLWGLSKDGIRNAVLYEELRRAVEAPVGVNWTLPQLRQRSAHRRHLTRATQRPLRR